MHPVSLEAVSFSSPAPAPRRTSSRSLYFALLGERGDDVGSIDELARSASRSFLLDRLGESERLNDESLPRDPRSLGAWLDAERQRTGESYRRYVDERKAGAPRRMFRNRSHALHFLRAVAPTKLVDGAWLYGVLRRANDARLGPLVRTYLDELGNGVAARHHVLLYRRLLEANGCDDWPQLPDAHFVQGAIQLALAHHADEFLPEVIGFNLGYEQLPLHLPISAYELAELGIDPYYFTLHVTVDNASTGHARKALDCVLDMLPRDGREGEFMRRVERGWRLNSIGMGTVTTVESFDLERALLDVLAKKASVGADLHSDRCRIDGKSVTAWLSQPDELPAFLECLQASGWIKRGAEPEESRFWRLLHDERGPMFGVFSAYEEQLLRDWIVGDAAGPADRRRARAATSPERTLSRRLAALPPGDPDDAADRAEAQALESRLLDASGKAEAMAVLQRYLSPRQHSTPTGLLATRLYAGLFNGHA